MATYKSIRYLVPDEVVEHTDSINALADVNTSTVAPEIGQTLKWSAANSRWQPADIEEESASATQKALFGFGKVAGGNGYRNITNLISSTGVVATDTTGVGTVRDGLGGASYGGDKAIFGFGRNNDDNNDMGQKNITNLVSNTGVVASDSTGVGKKKNEVCAAGYGGDKAFFGFGMHFDNYDELNQNQLNLVSNTGVVSTENTGVGTARQGAGAAGYGGDKAIIGFGYSGQRTNVTNLVSNTGIVSSDVTGVGTARNSLAAAGYGNDKAIFGFGWTGSALTNVTNLVSNTGVVSTDTTGVGTSRDTLAGVGYGGDKAIFGFGYTSGETNVTNLVSNTGVVASDTTGVGTARNSLAAAGYSTTA